MTADLSASYEVPMFMIKQFQRLYAPDVHGIK